MNTQLEKFNIVKRRHLTSFVKEIFYTDDNRVILRTPVEYTFNKEFYMWTDLHNPHIPKYEKIFSDEYNDYYICPEYKLLWQNKSFNPTEYDTFFEMRRYFRKQLSFYFWSKSVWEHNTHLYKFLEQRMVPLFGEYANALLNMAETLGENYQMRVNLDFMPRNVGFDLVTKKLVFFDVIFSYGNQY